MNCICALPRALSLAHTHTECAVRRQALSRSLSLALALTFVNCPEHCWLRWFPVHSRAKRKEEAIINVPRRRKTLITRFAPLAHEGVQELRCLGGCCHGFGFGGGVPYLLAAQELIHAPILSALFCPMSLGQRRLLGCPTLEHVLQLSRTLPRTHTHTHTSRQCSN